jgi:GNAT superfamily N-acetyltransferase
MWPADIPDVMRIERQSFGMPWQESTFRALMRRPSASLLTAEVDGTVVGFSVLWFAADEGELGDIAVDPEYRGRAGPGLCISKSGKATMPPGPSTRRWGLILSGSGPTTIAHRGKMPA